MVITLQDSLWPSDNKMMSKLKFVLLFTSFLSSGCVLDASLKNLDSLPEASLTYKVTIASQPEDRRVMDPLNSIVIELHDEEGRIIPAKVPVAVQVIATSGSTPKLYGSATATTINGVAQFTDLAVDLPGNDYLLVVSDSAGRSTTSMAFDISERQLDVTPFFPLNGAAFMTYVKRDPALKLHEQMDTAAFGIYKVHAGEMRKVPLPGFLDCDDLTMNDDLNAFDWRCYDQGTEIFFYSHGFKPQKGLRDLINTSSFKSNKVTLRKGSTVIGESPLSTTW